MQEDRALVYRRTTLVEEMPLKDRDTEFQSKRVKTVIDETSWIGDKPKRPSDAPPPPPQTTSRTAGDTQSWITDNPLYTPTEYESDYNNPLYVKMKVVQPSGQGIKHQTAPGGVDTLF